LTGTVFYCIFELPKEETMLASFTTGLVMENSLLLTRLPRVGTSLTVNTHAEEGSTFLYNRVHMKILSIHRQLRHSQDITIFVSLHYGGFDNVRGQLWRTTEGRWVLGVDNHHLAELQMFKRH